MWTLHIQPKAVFFVRASVSSFPCRLEVYGKIIRDFAHRGFQVRLKIQPLVWKHCSTSKLSQTSLLNYYGSSNTSHDNKKKCANNVLGCDFVNLNFCFESCPPRLRSNRPLLLHLRCRASMRNWIFDRDSNRWPESRRVLPSALTLCAVFPVFSGVLEIEKNFGCSARSIKINRRGIHHPRNHNFHIMYSSTVPKGIIRAIIRI